MRKAFHANEVVTEYARTLIRVKAKQIIRRPGFSRSDQDDVEQDLVLQLLNQAQHFDPARGSLNTFIARVVTSGVAMLVRERGRIKRCPANVAIQSLEVKLEQPDGPPAPLWATISHADLERRTGSAPLSDAERYELVEGVASVMASLPPELQKVCKSLMERNRAETEAELGMSRRGYEGAMDRIRQHFAQSGLAKN
jgi:RNA polymerase sigma-70 factor (ECF subfamily)